MTLGSKPLCLPLCSHFLLGVVCLWVYVCCLIISRIGMLKLLGLLQWLYLKLKETYGRFLGCSSSCYLYEHSWLWTHLNICLGVVKSKRSIWRISTITDFFWSIINFIGVFFATMFSVMFWFSLLVSMYVLQKYRSQFV